MFCSAVCKFSVYGLILLNTFDTDGGFIEKSQKNVCEGGWSKSNFWKISVLKGKLPLSFVQWKELADNTHTSCFLSRIRYSLCWFYILVFCPVMAAYNEYMQTRPTCSARAVDPSLPFETYEEILLYDLGSARVIKTFTAACNYIHIIFIHS